MKVKHVNNYKPPPPAPPPDDLHESTPWDEYDINWAGSKSVPVLRTKHVELRLAIPSIHAKPLHKHWYEITTARKLLPLDLTELQSFYTWLERMRRNSKTLLFIIFVDPSIFPQLPWNAPKHFDDPTASPGTEHFIMAGQSNLYDVSVGDLTACTGVGVFKQFEGHGIGSQAVALLYDWAMRLPKDGGLGMRRLWAGVSPWNEGSKALHSRLGLKAEGTRRAFEVTVEPMYGEHEGREGDPQWPHKSADEIVYAITNKDWETGGVKEIMASVLAGPK